MKKQLSLILFMIWALSIFSQEDSLNQERQRLDFAKMYFEIGGTVHTPFTGKIIRNNEVGSFDNSAAVMPYLNWGGFHFWGHGEFYVTFPLAYKAFQKNEGTSSELFHSVVTGFRFYPRVYKENSITPFMGINWSALDFKQVIEANDEQPVLSKDFLAAFDLGILYGYKKFALRFGLNFIPNNKWDYPISKTQKAEIKTPPIGIQMGLLYSFDSTKDTDQENIDKWNSYPTVSKQSLGSTSFGDFFIAVGPSISFSLQHSDYNKVTFPYLKERLASTNYFDIAAGYNFNKAGLFTVLSFRNPQFETEGYGTRQCIKKTSIAFEINKFLIDYSGFTPYLGINIAYDKIKYSENIDGLTRELTFDKKIEPGINFGWDIQPGKNQEALILRTNLRWYPFSSFEIDNKQFQFSQLEYNLIQVLFYPNRLKKKKRH